MGCAQIDSGKVFVPVTSGIFNVLNFILFDILLASFAFGLTGDIAGLVNSSSALSQLGNRLQAYNPPLVGVGLTCTRKNVFRLLALLRGLVMLAVLGTNFLIEGKTCELETREMHDVVVPGYIPPSTDLKEVLGYSLRRRGCMGRKGDEIYYGELRLNHSCELRPELMVTEPIYFGLDYINVTIKHKAKCRFYRSKDFYSDNMHQYDCPNLGTIGCPIHPRYEKLSKTSLCEGVILVDGISHLCWGEALYPGSSFQPQSKNRVAHCRLSRGLNTSDPTWVPLRLNLAPTLRDIIDALHGVGIKRMEVRIASAKNVRDASEIDVWYFWVLGFVFALLAILSAIDLALRWTGLHPTAHDELGLGSLLAQSAANAAAYYFPQLDDFYCNEHDNRPIRHTNRPELFVQNSDGVIRASSRRH